MESIFRLLLHEQTLVQVNNYDPKLLTLIGYHRRDLVTTLETAKWQALISHFERAVTSSARMDQSQSREDAIFRHKQFISAIREQINNVDKSLEEMEVGNTMKNPEWKNLNEQDKDNLALFLSGGIHNECNHHYELDDDDIFKRFLDPVTSTCSTDAGIVGNRSGEIEDVNMNGFADTSRYDSMEESNLRKEDSQNIKLGLDSMDSFEETSCNRNVEDGSWDLEASEGKPKCFFHGNELRGSSSQVNIFGFFNNLWTAYGSRVPSNYTKQLKDGEEEHSPLYIDASHVARGRHIGPSSAPRDHGLRGLRGFLVKVMHLRRRLGACNVRFDRFSSLIRVNQRSIKMILAIVFAFTLLGKHMICMCNLLFILLYL
ncbi:Iron-sulfur cluster biosynthesis family protein isoform 1 [Hibiscus syriacus]|uniref:Iron-sulfur cluster biosynthesis family protein isoform 1 n=1 Tax=Hibiscus syriacus TaxID=106335 RepID=A0A6A2WM09_HIBSY|nr:Iron-sulfur cluster biosynthesis family protein isoform 1 [Hibiscus syriacus]